MAIAPVRSGPQVNYSAVDEALFTKLSWRLLPLLVTCYVIAFIDRINIGFAQARGPFDGDGQGLAEGRK